ncbi:hypothetical protein Hdeb2414_s0001g00021371 [Helianthus debilis subsp. tardiflorus]
MEIGAAPPLPAAAVEAKAAVVVPWFSLGSIRSATSGLTPICFFCFGFGLPLDGFGCGSIQTWVTTWKMILFRMNIKFLWFISDFSLDCFCFAVQVNIRFMFVFRVFVSAQRRSVRFGSDLINGSVNSQTWSDLVKVMLDWFGSDSVPGQTRSTRSVLGVVRVRFSSGSTPVNTISFGSGSGRLGWTESTRSSLVNSASQPG